MQLDLYENHEELSADRLNRPLVQLQAELAALRQQVEVFASGTRTMTTAPYDTGADNPVLPGCVVYIGADGMARRAAATWNASAGSDGVIMPSDSAYTAGIAVFVDSTLGTCDIMTRGSVPLNVTPGFAANLFGGSQTTYNGSWMLSQTAPGTVQRDASGLYLKIPVVKVDALDNVYYTGAQPYAGYHIHKSFTIAATETWTEDTDNNDWYYTNGSVAELSYFNWNEFTASINGVEDYSGVITLEEGGTGVVVRASENPTGSVVKIYVALPDSHEQPVVRGIRTVGSGRLWTSSANGLVTIGVDGWEGVEPAPIYRDRAVAALADNGGYTMTHVVSGLQGDETMQLTQGANGVWYVSCANMTDITPVITSLDNSTVTVLNGVLYYIFPASRASGITGAVRVPAPPSGSHWIARPYVQGAASTLSVAASFVWAPDPGVNSSANPAAALTPASISLTAYAVNGRYKAMDMSTGWTLSSGGEGWLRLDADGTSASDMNMICFGLKLEAEED